MLGSRAITDETIGRVIQFCFDRAKDVVGKQQTPYIAAAPGEPSGSSGLLFVALIPESGLLSRFVVKENRPKSNDFRRFFVYAADGGRTRTLSPERDFKSLVSANFTTAAQKELPFEGTAVLIIH